MLKLSLKAVGGALLACGLAATAQATVISFDGGTTSAASDVYEEDGFRLETIGGPAYFGDYYSVGNNVIHSHWLDGGYGSVTKILVTKLDGAAFDLNYFILTSNTITGGGRADGNEKTYIHASSDGVTDDYAQLLPSEDWCFPATQIFLGSEFDNVKAFWFTETSGVACFGMDEFYINEPAPETVPEPGSFALAGLAIVALGITRRRKPV